MFARTAIAALALVLGGCQTWRGGTSVILDYDTPQEFAAECEPWDEWSKRGPTFQVDEGVANGTYYVGSCGIAMLAVRIENGVVLVDTGEAQFHEDLLRNLKGIAVDPEDVRYILTSHEHYDHIGGLAAMQQATGARIVTSPAAKPVIESGTVGEADPQFAMHDPMEPARVWKTIDDGETITLGGKHFTAIHTPGHTPGALTWAWSGRVDRRSVSIVYADSLSPVSRDDYRFSDHPDYLADYRAGLDRLKALDCDILLTPHPAASFMNQRAATGSFEGGTTCADYAAAVERRLVARLEREAGGDQ